MSWWVKLKWNHSKAVERYTHRGQSIRRHTHVDVWHNIPPAPKTQWYHHQSITIELTYQMEHYIVGGHRFSYLPFMFCFFFHFDFPHIYNFHLSLSHNFNLVVIYHWRFWQWVWNNTWCYFRHNIQAMFSCRYAIHLAWIWKCVRKREKRTIWIRAMDWCIAIAFQCMVFTRHQDLLVTTM